MSQRWENEIDRKWLLRVSGWIVCIIGVTTLFFYPLHGIGLLLFGEFLAHRSEAFFAGMWGMGSVEYLKEIAAHLDDMKGKDSART